MPERDRFFITCEHAGNRVPERYEPLFQGHEELLGTHRGHDIGAMDFARDLARELTAPLESAEITRLLVDMNRSLHSRTLFTEVGRELEEKEQERVLRHYYHPYREAVAEKLGSLTDSGFRVVHLSVHSFTPVLFGQLRKADLGLLYDPSRRAEKVFCHGWQGAIKKEDPALRVRCNYPYRGISDSLVTALRKRFTEKDYLGIEIEINQKFPQGDSHSWRLFRAKLLHSLRHFLDII